MIFPLSFLILLWLIQFAQYLFLLKLVKYGLLPQTTKGLTGIFTAPLIHSGFNHIISNSIPLLFLGSGIFYFYKEAAYKVFFMVYFIPGILVWFLGRESFHIGSSGLVYGYVTFLFFSGLIRRDNRSIALALIVTFLYGSLIWGVLPLSREISWEYHLFGALTGIYAAIIFRKSDPIKKYDWEEEE
ncbi:MAG: rhomboid family intramembrane serine protease [Bacteroidetes bacterium]|nr:rhomboid family intramembrane serine protease [Bacteroidota bacterium]MCH8941205.1 rhomboid family intramembrane serine protease [Bacteroidota bacterium]